MPGQLKSPEITGVEDGTPPVQPHRHGMKLDRRIVLPMFSLYRLRIVPSEQEMKLSSCQIGGDFP